MSQVLLIEPDASLGRIYVQALQHAGHIVLHASNAQDAIAAADEATPDIVVLELQLAVHNGIEFLHEFRSYPEWQQIPIIINSSIAPASMLPVGKALEHDLGVVECLYKPRVSLQQLLGVVGNWTTTR